jgi:replicative DNA helicase
MGAKGRPANRVTVTGRDDVERFIGRVGAVGIRKRDARAEIARRLEERPTRNTNRDVIPREAWRTIVLPRMRATGVTHRAMQAAVGQRYCGSTLHGQNMSRERALRVARGTDSGELAILAMSDVYWDEILSIEPAGVEPVYDLTVEGLHNFQAADICVHNSIEQDADLVMFLYRDEYYNENSEDQGLAEVILAKHRNGPVGTEKLAFLKRFAKFADLAPQHDQSRAAA